MLSPNRLALVVVSMAAAGACGFPADANRDGDMAAGVGFQFPTSLTDETVGTHTVSVALSRPAEDVVTVDVEVVESGTATPGEDFSLVAGQIAFPVGADRADIDITINDDGNDTEGDQTIVLRLVNASNADIFRDDHTVTISDTPLPRFNWTEPASTAGEGDGTQTFRISFTRTLPIETQIAVVTSGTASTVDDYTAPPATLVVPAGVDMFDVEVPINDENIDEDPENAALTLSAITGAILDPDSNGVHDHTITDNDDPPIAAFQVISDTQGESAGTKQVVVTLTPHSGKTVMIGFNDNTGTTSGGAGDGDYDINTAMPLVFNPGDTQKTIAVLPLTDTLYEDNEVVALSLTVDTATATLSPTNGSTVLTIDDDDNMPGIGFMAATSNATEGNPQNVVVALTAVSGKDVSFSFTNMTGTAVGADYSFATAEVTIPAGTATYTLPVSITDDNIAEGNETFTVGLTGISDATLTGNTTHVVTIAANDACQVRWDPTEVDGDSPEGDGSGFIDYSYDITLSNPSAATVTVLVTRTGDANDFDADILPSIPQNEDQTFTFNASDVSESLTVRVYRDDFGGGGDNEDTVTLTLSAPTGCTLGLPATTVRNHVIADDD